MDAYIAGLEAVEGDLSKIASVASFFVSRVDTLVDKKLNAIGTEEALNLKGKVLQSPCMKAHKEDKYCSNIFLCFFHLKTTMFKSSNFTVYL